MSLTQDPPSAGSAGAGWDDDIDPRVISDAACRIARDHPSQPLATIEALLADRLAASRGVAVRNFRLLLAERGVRKDLSDRRRPHQAGP